MDKEDDDNNYLGDIRFFLMEKQANVPNMPMYPQKCKTYLIYAGWDLLIGAWLRTLS